MASEVTVNGSLAFAKNSVSERMDGSFSADAAGDHAIHSVKDVSTSEEELEIGDVVNIGFVMIRNMDSTNYIEVGATTGVYSIKIKAGESMQPTRWAANHVFVKANTAAVKIEYMVTED